jgi:hypothetical protein
MAAATAVCVDGGLRERWTEGVVEWWSGGASGLVR